MTTGQLEAIPDHLLMPHARGAVELIEWLAWRGWSMTLLELHQERQRRGITTRQGRWS
jgi:hypothetical protein